MASILIAVLAGLILNFMPCVLPVLAIKLWSITNQAADGKSSRMHGLIYSIGCISTFIVLGLLFLTASSFIPGWGSYMGSPIILGILIVIFLFLGLCSFDIVTLPVNLDMVAAKVTTDLKGYALSLVGGVLAPFVGSACLAPFMGVTIGVALNSSLAYGLTLFAALGFGMAVPVLVISMFPKLIAYIPKTGRANVILKYIIGGGMFLTSAWFGYILFTILNF